jgi:hypothetical protein
LLVYFNDVVRAALAFNGVGLLVGVLLHAIIIGDILKRHGKLASGPRQGSEVAP